MELGQKRGYASLNRVVAAISHGKVVDFEVMSKVCQARAAIGINRGGKTHLDLKVGKENITAQ